MNPRARRMWSVWNGRNASVGTDRAYLAYVVMLLTLVVIAPVIRVVWLVLAEDDAAGLLRSEQGATWVTALLCLLLASATGVGSHRGPIVLAPFLTHAITQSGDPGRQAFGGRFSRSVVVTAAVGTCAGAVLGSGLATTGDLPIGAGVAVTVRGTALGVLAAIGWLVGESSPRLAVTVAAALAVAGGALLVAAASGSGLPVAAPVVDVGLLGVAVAAAVSVPHLLDRIDEHRLMAQARRWELAIAHTVSLELSAASNAYRGEPSRGRRMRVTPARSSSLALLAVRRDLVGALRTPGRLGAGVTAMIAAGACLAAAAALPGAAGALGATAAALLFAGVGPVARGLVHVVDVARDLPLHGVSDLRLVLLHSVAPVTIAVLGTVTSATGSAVLTGSPLSARVLVTAAVLPAFVVAARVSDALRGPAPLGLLAPAPSALGDPMPVLRLLWAADAFLVALSAGAVLPTASAVLGGAGAAVVLALTLVVRWVRR